MTDKDILALAVKYSKGTGVGWTFTQNKLLEFAREVEEVAYTEYVAIPPAFSDDDKD